MVDDIRLPESVRRGGDSVDNDKEPDFTPPEVLAEEEDVIDMAGDNVKEESAGKKDSKKPSKTKSPFKKFGAWWKGLSKKKKIIVALVALLVISLLAGGAYALFKPEKASEPVAEQKVEEAPPPTTETSKLTGVQVPIGTNQKPIIGVMIENSPDARPQASINAAGAVFEAVAEGGITRFLVLHLDNQPDYVGPVRSVRPYYLSWLQAYDAPIAHAGGSDDARAKIIAEGIPDLDHGGNGAYFQRVSNRYSPHNLNTSMQKLLELSEKKGFKSPNAKSLERKAEAPAATPTAKAINVAISSPLYNVHYDYHAETNSYGRSQGGAPHLDERSGKQIEPKVVVVMVMSKGINPNGVNSTYGTIGSGTAFVFQDGNVTQGTWTKGSDKDQIKLTDSSGAVIGLNAGFTWFTAVGVASSVTYTP